MPYEYKFLIIYAVIVIGVLGPLSWLLHIRSIYLRTKPANGWFPVVNMSFKNYKLLRGLFPNAFITHPYFKCPIYIDDMVKQNEPDKSWYYIDRINDPCLRSSLCAVVIQFKFIDYVKWYYEHKYLFGKSMKLWRDLVHSSDDAMQYISDAGVAFMCLGRYKNYFEALKMRYDNIRRWMINSK